MMQKYIKSPLNYVGGKYKLLDEIIPLFPNHISTFVDLFGGGYNIGINANAEHFVYNDICTQVVELLKCLKNKETDDLLKEIDEYIELYNLSKENQDGFIKLRKDYNSQKTPIKFYTMICYAFNNQIRFNKNNEYNMPFGKNRSSFNSVLRQKFVSFVEALHKQDCCFMNLSFDQFDFSHFKKEDFIYCDPPYFNSVASYNEQNGWTEKDENELLSLLDKLHDNGIRWALSNNLKYKNDILKEWKEKYKVYYLDSNYSNCNYQKKDKSKDIEVLIVNY